MNFYKILGSSKGSNEYKPPELEALKNWETTSITSAESPINRLEFKHMKTYFSVFVVFVATLDYYLEFFILIVFFFTDKINNMIFII